jgi:hypothetical protein
MAKKISIGKIGNFYGGLEIKENNGKYYWGIENYNGTDFEEITKELFDALLKFQLQTNKN